MAKKYGKRLLSMFLAVMMTLSMAYCMFDASMISALAADVDPISDSDFGTDALTLEEVIEASDSDVVTTIGQLVYRFGNYDTVNSAIIEDVIDGKVVALQLYNSLDAYKIGDVLKITGTKTTYNGIPQMQSLTETVVLKEAKDVDTIPALEYDIFAELDADFNLSAHVKINNVKLGAYVSDGSTKVKDKTGAEMEIYRAASYPTGVTEGEEVTYMLVHLHIRRIINFVLVVQKIT